MREYTFSERLRSWSVQHALLMTLAIAVVWWERSAALAAALAAGSFLGFLVRFRDGWTPGGSFGWANAITLLRLAGVLCVLLAGGSGDTWVPVLALGLLLADGVDGWAARRFGFQSDFGSLFDQEVDALFFLALCVLLYLHQDFGAWALFPGSLRYAFVLYTGAGRPSRHAATGNRWTRAIGTGALVALSLCLLPVGAACTWLAAGAGLVVTFSFLYSARQLHRPAGA